MTREEIEAWAREYCDRNGYPGGQMALPVHAIVDMLSGKVSREDLQRQQFGKHQCLYSSGEDYPEHCVTCGVAVNDSRRSHSFESVKRAVSRLWPRQLVAKRGGRVDR